MAVPPSSPSLPPSMSASSMLRRWARKCERYCSVGISYFPLLFVYGLTTWAVWVEASIGFLPSKSAWIGRGTSILGIALYLFLNWSYTMTVFTDPGSTTNYSHGYNSLPTSEPPVATSFTVKSTGEVRFCKKCQARKPDRAHHCKSCRRCVLKMDHHCPWVATCVGLRNQKAFLLFLIYTSIFCIVCFAVSAVWLWSEVFQNVYYSDSIMPVNYAMLAVISGIIGLVLTGFTGWHISLAARGQTTIECLESTRYLSPLRAAMRPQHIVRRAGEDEVVSNYGQQLPNIHSNIPPSVTRPQGGEARFDVGAQNSYNEMERRRARERYNEYLDDQYSKKLPNAFDLGWRKNLLRIFGRKTSMWFIPICTTTDDGWRWEPNPKWLIARENIRNEREEQLQRESEAGWGTEALVGGHNRDEPSPSLKGAGRHYLNLPVQPVGRHLPSKADRVLGREPSQYADIPSDGPENGLSMQALRPKTSDINEDECSDNEHAARTPQLNGGSWSGGPLGVGASRLLSRLPEPRREAWAELNRHVDDTID